MNSIENVRTEVNIRGDAEVKAFDNIRHGRWWEQRWYDCQPYYNFLANERQEQNIKSMKTALPEDVVDLRGTMSPIILAQFKFSVFGKF